MTEQSKDTGKVASSSASEDQAKKAGFGPESMSAKPVNQEKTTAAKAETKKVPDKKNPNQQKSKASDDKAEPSKVEPKKSASKTANAKSPGSSKPTASKPGTAKPGPNAKQPMTAGDYARTTKSSPDTTAVIPAIKEDLRTPPTGAATTPAPKPAGRRAELRLVRVEPWSVARLTFVVSVALMIVAVVAVTIFWIVLEITGVWDQVNGSITSVLSDESTSFDITDYLGLGRLVGLTLVLSAINVVVMTALATIGAHLYNLAALLIGGADVTFGEED